MKVKVVIYKLVLKDGSEYYYLRENDALFYTSEYTHRIEIDKCDKLTYEIRKSRMECLLKEVRDENDVFVFDADFIIEYVMVIAELVSTEKWELNE